jgi:Carboxypeptidase regulatory-like domain
MPAPSQTRLIPVVFILAWVPMSPTRLLATRGSPGLQSAGFRLNAIEPNTTTSVARNPIKLNPTTALDPRLPRQPANPEPTFTISGTVVDALTSAPLAQTRVTLIDSTNPAKAIWTVTSADGRFTFTSLAAHKFALQGARRGYSRAAYDQHGQFSTAIVTGAGINTENLVLRLTPLAAISGRVLDESGEPVRNASVTLYREEDQDGLHRTHGRGRDTTDDQGFYEFSTIAPGNYYLSTSAKPWYAVNPPRAKGTNTSPTVVDRSLDVVYPSTFYNGTTDSDAATPIPLRGGDHLQIDFHLNPVPALHVFIRVPEAENGRQPFPMLQRHDFDATELVNFQGSDQIAPGVYEVTGVPPGRYSFHLGSESMFPQETISQMDLRTDNQEVDISRVEHGTSLNISVKLPGREPPPSQLALALENAHHDRSDVAEVDASGRAVFSSVSPGQYSIRVFSGPIPYSVTRVITKGQEISGREISVAPAASQDVTVLLTAGVVSVEGFVKLGGRPVPGVMVVLVPKDPDSDQDLFRRDQSDLDGSFTVRGVLPGSYTLIALENAWTLPWRETAALNRYLSKGQPITVGPLMQRTVTLPDPVPPQSP